jgi:HAD superfamily hydrolase (TIGR01509 family)
MSDSSVNYRPTARLTAPASSAASTTGTMRALLPPVVRGAAELGPPDVPRGKPDPALFLLAAKALDVPPARCLVVEDAPAGIEAARAGRPARSGDIRTCMMCFS